MTHPFLEQAQAREPKVLSAYWCGQQVLRIENGEVVLDVPVKSGFGLLTFHFDDEPTPVYCQVISGES